MKEEKKLIKRMIYKKFGWTLEWWAKERGFSRWQIYDFLRGKAGEKTVKRILNALKQDGIIDDLQEMRDKNDLVCSDVSKSESDRPCMSKMRAFNF